MARTGMTIGGKLNLILVIIFCALLGVNALDDYLRQRDLVVKGAVDHARLLARQIIETRNYLSSVVKDEPEHNSGLIPQVAATQIARTLSDGRDFRVRQISLRYRNPDNRPTPYEQSALESLAAGDAGERYEVVAEEQGRVFRYLLPMIAEKSCLECHGTFEAAPAFVKRRFPPGHPSYNYREGEVIGAVSVTIPMGTLYRLIGTNLGKDLLLASVSFMVILLVMGWLARRIVVAPIRQLAETIGRVTLTGAFQERLQVRTSDEVGQVFAAFNALMEELEGKTVQTRESAERYRSLVEMSQSAILTFMADGKIISVNQKAESLFGRPRSTLLGDSIFDYLADGEHLRRGLADFEQTGAGGGVGETMHHTVKVHGGELASLETALAVSIADGRYLFTMIIRESHPRPSTDPPPLR